MSWKNSPSVPASICSPKETWAASPKGGPPSFAGARARGAMVCRRQRRFCACKEVDAMTCKRQGRCFGGARDTKRSKAGLPLSEAAPKHYLAPLWSNTTPMVRKIHFKSSAIERSRMYCISNWIFSSGSRSYPPDTWARPVSPGLTTMR